MEPIRILIADDQTITRSGLRALLAAQARPGCGWRSRER